MQVLIYPLEIEGQNIQENIISIGASTVRIIYSNVTTVEMANKGNLILKASYGNFKDHLDKLANMYRILASDKGLFILLWIDPYLPDTILYDSGKLSQIMANLFNNAIKFTKRGGIFVIVEWIEKNIDEGKIKLYLNESNRDDILKAYEGK